MPKKTEALSYDTAYHFSFTDGMTRERIFDVLRLHRHLEQRKRLIQLGLYMENDRFYAAGGPGSDVENFLGHAYADIEGMHRRGVQGSDWFVFGRFRNDLAVNALRPAPMNRSLPVEGPWSAAFFCATIDLDYGVTGGSSMGTLLTGRQSFFTSPLREYEKLGDRLGRPFE